MVQSITQLFKHAVIVDRRQKPSHGYRAVHVIVESLGRLVKIQVRTSLQHIWAEQSEKVSDVLDPSIKYGGGEENIRAALTGMSLVIAKYESLEIELAHQQMKLTLENEFTNEDKIFIANAQEDLNAARQSALEGHGRVIKMLEKIKGEKDALSD